MLKVAVVGAGAAGLCCARYLCRHPNRFAFCVFEKAREIGGTWLYTDRTEQDEYGLPEHSSMYAELRTNLPKELMDIPELPFREDLPSFIGHREMLEYLRDLATAFDLHKHVRFHTNVESVEPVERESRQADDDVCGVVSGGIRDSVRWRVQTRDLELGTVSKEIYDIVVVCNGHYSKPYIPADIPGLQNFPGEVIHSHVFRRAARYAGKRVLIVGSRASGGDILLHVAPIAHSVCLVYHTKPAVFKIPPNSEQQPEITAIDTDGRVHFKNGESRVVDNIILCTGYQFGFPFLTSDSGITVEAGKRVNHVYKHTFNIEHPSMVFVGLNYPVVPFPFLDVQARFAMSVLTGDTKLPPREEMLTDTKSDYVARSKEGIPHKHSHRLTDQFVFIRELVQIAGLKPHPLKYEKLNKIVFEARKYNLPNFRKYDYSVTESTDGEVVITKHLRAGETLV